MDPDDSAQPKRAPRSERSGGRPRPVSQEDEGFPRPDGPEGTCPEEFAGGRPGGQSWDQPNGRPDAHPGIQPGPGAKLYFGAAAALGVILIVVAVAAVALMGGGGKGESAGQTPSAALGTHGGSGYSPASYSSSPSSAAYERVAARSGDSAPLTIGEAFPGSAASVAVPEGSARLTLRAKRLDGDCGAAVWGQTVWADLQRGGCTQAVRGLYADTGRGYGLSVTVFNLAAATDADRFVDTLGRGRGGGFVRPLQADAPLDRFGQGFGMARGLAMGHYAVIAWAQRLDGKGDEKDETLLSLLIEGGKPPGVLGRAAGGD